jgi:hypothetical protein
MKRLVLLLPLLALAALSSGCADLAFRMFSTSTQMSNGRVYPRTPSFSIAPMADAPSSAPEVYVREQPQEFNLGDRIVFRHKAFYLWDSGHFAISSSSDDRSTVLNGDGLLFEYNMKGKCFEMGFFKRAGKHFTAETGVGSTYTTIAGRYSGEAILVEETRQRHPVSWPAKLPEPIRYDPPVRYVRVEPLQPVPLPDWPPSAAPAPHAESAEGAKEPAP